MLLYQLTRIKDLLNLLDKSSHSLSIWTDVACWGTLKGFALGFEGRKVVVVADLSKDSDVLLIYSGFDDQFDTLYGNMPLSIDPTVFTFSDNSNISLTKLLEHIEKELGFNGELYLR